MGRYHLVYLHCTVIIDTVSVTTIPPFICHNLTFGDLNLFNLFKPKSYQALSAGLTLQASSLHSSVNFTLIAKNYLVTDGQTEKLQLNT